MADQITITITTTEGINKYLAKTSERMGLNRSSLIRRMIYIFQEDSELLNRRVNVKRY